MDESIHLSLDAPDVDAEVCAPWLRVRGWVLSRTGALAQVEAFLDDAPLGALPQTVERADVLHEFPDAPLRCGFDTDVVLPDDVQGTHELVVRATDSAGHAEQRRAVRITSTRPIHLALDTPTQEATLTDDVTIRGWAVSAAARIHKIEVTLNDTALAAVAGGEARPDAEGLMPSRHSIRGFKELIQLPPTVTGSAQLRIRVTDRAGHATQCVRDVTLLGRSVPDPTPPEPEPIDAFLDTPSGPTPLWAPWLQVHGWAVSTAGAIDQVEAFLDDTPLGALPHAVERPDVVHARPGADLRCGFSHRLLVPEGSEGTHELMVCVTDSAGRTRELRRTVRIAGSRPVHLALDAPRSETPLTDIVTVRGWAVSAAAPVHMVEAWLGDTSLGPVAGREERPDAIDLVLSPHPLCGFVQTFPIPPGARHAGQLRVRVTDASGHVADQERPVTISTDTTDSWGERSATHVRNILATVEPPISPPAPMETIDVLRPDQLRSVEAGATLDATEVPSEHDRDPVNAHLDGDESGKVVG